MRSLVWALIQHYWCPCNKRKMGHGWVQGWGGGVGRGVNLHRHRDRMAILQAKERSLKRNPPR